VAKPSRIIRVLTLIRGTSFRVKHKCSVLLLNGQLLVAGSVLWGCGCDLGAIIITIWALSPHIQMPLDVFTPLRAAS
jgi:hypothetical protein